MQVSSPLSALGSAASSNQTSTKEAGKVDYDSFLQLLVAQLKNQDPLNPADPTQFVSQLATLSGLEQSIKHNEKLDQLLSSFAAGSAGSILGRTVTSADGAITGVVVSSSVTTTGVTATLDNGQVLTIGPGVLVRA